MLRKELEREAEGKQTSFSYHGQPVSETKMENYRKRLQEALDALIAEHPHSPAGKALVILPG